MATTKVKQSTRTLGTGEVAIGNISGSAAASAGTYLKQDGTWAAVASGIEWQAVQTTGFTAVADKGYPCNTTAAAFTVTLPASASVGDQIAIVDYAGTFDTNKITIDPNGLKIKGGTDNLEAVTERQATTLTYVDATQGWVATSGVNTVEPALPTAYYSVDFLVIAGGGGGGGSGVNGGGGAGAGGYRTSYGSGNISGGLSAVETDLTFNPSIVYTITVGGGGPAGATGGDGETSSITGSDITDITTVGGGGGATASGTGRSGGSGSGGGRDAGTSTSGAGTANQGFAGGDAGGITCWSAGGGGGAGAVGYAGAYDCSPSGAYVNGNTASNGGTGISSSITDYAVTRAGGGGGAWESSSGSGHQPPGGTGGGGKGATSTTSNASTAGTVNTGGGGGAGKLTNNASAGGSGVVILRMLTSRYSTTTTGSPTVTAAGLDTILTYTGDGSYTG